MTCLINLLAWCVFDPSAVYIAGDMYQSMTTPSSGGRWCRDHWCRGPMADLRVGVRVDISRSIELDYGVRHASFLDEDDRGEESAYVGLTWRPFR